MLRKTEAKRYAYDLVMDGKFCYHQLKQDEREMLTGLIMKATPLSYLHEYIGEADKKNELPIMLAHLLENPGKDAQEDLVNMLKENACDYSAKQIDAMLEEASAEYEFNRKYDDGSL